MDIVEDLKSFDKLYQNLHNWSVYCCTISKELQGIQHILGDLHPLAGKSGLAMYTVSQKKGPTLKRYSSKLYGSILMIFGGNIQKSLE